MAIKVCTLWNQDTTIATKLYINGISEIGADLNSLWKIKGQRTIQHFIFYDCNYENCVLLHQMTYRFDFTTSKSLRTTQNDGKNNRGKENTSGGKQRLTNILNSFYFFLLLCFLGKVFSHTVFINPDTNTCIWSYWKSIWAQRHLHHDHSRT